MNDEILKNNIKKILSSPQLQRVFWGVLIAFIGLIMSISSPSETLHTVQKNDSTIYNSTINPFDRLVIEGEAAIVWDVVRQEALYSKNATTQLPLASLTKIMTAIVATEELKENNIITITSEAIIKEGDSGLFVGEKWRLKDLIDLMLITSSNDSASALASAVTLFNSSLEHPAVKNLFINKLRDKVNEIGMDQTFFINESGLDISNDISGAYGSAEDVSKLFSYAIKYYPALIEGTRYKSQEIISLDEISHHATNTNKSIEKLPAIIASKTGYTEIAGGNLAVAYEMGPMHPMIVVVLGSSRDGRFVDVEKLIDASFKYFYGSQF